MTAGASGREGTAPGVSWRAEVALVAPTWAEAVGQRRRLALGLPGVARSSLARSGEKGSAWRGAAERAKARGASVSARACGCNLRALGVPSARTGRAR